MPRMVILLSLFLWSACAHASDLLNTDAIQGPISNKTFDSTNTYNGGTLSSPTIAGTVSGGATYTGLTLTNPTLQGTVGAGTGLTMPAFTASGEISGTGPINLPLKGYATSSLPTGPKPGSLVRVTDLKRGARLNLTGTATGWFEPFTVNLDAHWFGATGNTQEVTAGATISAASTALAVTGATFTSASDVGKQVVVFGAGATTAAPPAPTVALAGAGAGNVNNGTHSYKLVAWTWWGMSLPSAASSQVTTTGGNGQVNVTVPIPVFPIHSYGVYRTVAGDTGNYLLVGQSFGGTFTDNAADSYLGAAAPTSDASVAPLYSTISSVTDSTHVVLADAATNAVTNGRVDWGTDDTAALDAWAAAATDYTDAVLPCGTYWYMPSANDTATKAMIFEGSHLTVHGRGDCSTFYFPRLVTFDHSTTVIAMLEAARAASRENVLFADFRILSEAPNGLMPGNTVPPNASTPYAGIQIGNGTSTSILCQLCGVRNVTFEKMGWNSVVFNGGGNTHPTQAFRGNFIERSRVYNSNNGEFNTLSGGTLKCSMNDNYFDSIGNIAIELSSHCDLLGNRGRNIGSGWVSTNNISTQEGWSLITGNNFEDVGRFNGATTVTAAAYLGQGQPQTRIQYINNVTRKSAGPCVWANPGATDLKILDNTCDEFGVGGATHYFGTFGTVTFDGIEAAGGTNVEVARNTVRAGTSGGDTSRYGILSMGGSATGNQVYDNVVTGTYTSGPYYLPTSVGAGGTGARNYAWNNRADNGTALIAYDNFNASGVNAVPYFTDGATTPSVAGSDVWYTSNSAPTTITNFTNPSVGQVIRLVFTDAQTTVAYNANFILLANGLNFASTVNSSITLVYTNTGAGLRWVEVARSRQGTYTTGSSSVANGTTSIAVTHGSALTPTASQITITPTNNPTNDPGNWYVDTITSTQFTVHTRADPGASGFAFNWAVNIP